jgi:tRNA pseudouridine32 synthase/23S rRNA pseudouridine746 synthase
MRPSIIFQNEHFVACYKEPLCLTTPSRFSSDDQRPVLGRILEEVTSKRIWPVHRLDFEVSGLVLFATSEEAHRAANLAFEHRLVKKNYRALSSKCLSEELFELERSYLWESVIAKGKKRAYEATFGKPSQTRAVLLASGQKHMLWSLSPLTGRSHQLRFELSKRKMPIVGDKLYGSIESFEKGIALQSVSLEFGTKELFERFGLPFEIVVSPNELLTCC